MHMRIKLQDRMKHPLFYLGVNTLLALLVIACALFGRTLGMAGPSLQISLVWPATGVSLAALLLFGYRASLGVFAGNFIYNVLHFSADPHSEALLSALIISFGSLAQCVLSAYILFKFSSPQFFKTVNDVFIFLVPASLGACLIASSLGSIVLYFTGSIPFSSVPLSWLLFWLGDTMGIYIITPLLITWLTPSKKRAVPLKNAIQICAVFILLCSVSFLFHYALLHLYVPLALWAAYVFTMRGASLAIFAFAATSLAYATFIQGLEGASLFALTTFLGVTSVASLILAAVVQEREEALDQIEQKNLALREEVGVSKEIIHEAHTEIYKKRKEASKAVLRMDILGKIEKPVEGILVSSKQAISITEELPGLLSQGTKLQTSEALSKLSLELKTIEKLSQIISKMIEIVPALGTEQRTPLLQSVNIHTLLNDALAQTLSKVEQDALAFTLTTQRDFDRSIKMVPLVVEDFMAALKTLLNHALKRLKTHYAKHPEKEKPLLHVRTEAQNNLVVITIRDNAPSVTEEQLKAHMEKMAPELAKAKEVIVDIHQGSILFTTDGGGFLEVTISLPLEFHTGSA